MTKYKFIYRSKIEIEYEFEFSKKILRITEFMIFYFCAGYVVFDIVFAKAISVITVVFMAIGVIQLFWHHVAKAFLPLSIRKKFTKLTYSQAKEGFFSDYESENPVTKLSNYKALIQETGFKGMAVKPEEFGKLFKDILEQEIVFDQPLDSLPFEKLFTNQKNRRVQNSSGLSDKIPTNNEELTEPKKPRKKSKAMKRKFYSQVSDLIFEDHNEQDQKFDYAPLNDVPLIPDEPLSYDQPLEQDQPLIYNQNYSIDNSRKSNKFAKHDDDQYQGDDEVRNEKKNKRGERDSVKRTGKKE